MTAATHRPTTDFSNRLQKESSPYLRQHQHNPVDWYPWGKEAFARAQAEDRPILLSIGYSACHWCHVMAHESFEDPRTAELMNQHYINIKVDREEHPDVDQLYQQALQVFSESGGWPLTMFLTPTGEPIFGGTYFPPEDRYGRPSFARVLMGVAQAFQAKRSELVQQASQVISALRRFQDRAQADEEQHTRFVRDFAQRAALKLVGRMDPREGGFGNAPKFPNPTALSLILRGATRGGVAEEVFPVLLTLTKMAEGGIYDQLGGGFARYSTDAVWLVPHFEKMLYDNAQLLKLYAEGAQVLAQDPRGAQAVALYEQVVRQTIGWAEREMRDPQGGFYAAQDADSEGVEGKYFVFSPEEVSAHCGPDAAAVLCRCYDIRQGGNWNDPHGHGEKGKSILHLVDRPRDEGEARLFAEGQTQLFLARQKRVPPGTDDKVLCGWNGLMISGLAEAGRLLGEPSYLAAAARAADFALRVLFGDGKLRRTYKDGVAKLPATLDDHAFLAEGLFHLAAASAAPDRTRYLAAAKDLTDSALLQFYNEADGLFYLSPAADAESDTVPLPVRPTSLTDSAVPSGLSALCLGLLRLAQLLAKSADTERYLHIAERMLRRYADQALRSPFGLANLCAAVDLYQQGLCVTVIVHGKDQNEAAQALRRAADRIYVPDHFVLVRNIAKEAETPDENLLMHHLVDKTLKEGQATAYVCQGPRCSAPVIDPNELSALLLSLTRY